MGLNIMKMWPISGVMKKNAEVEATQAKSSRLRNGLKKLFRQHKKADHTLNLDASIHPEPVIESSNVPSSEGPEDTSAGTDELNPGIASLTEGSQADEEAQSTTAERPTINLVGDFEVGNWDEFVDSVLQPVDQSEDHTPEDNIVVTSGIVDVAPLRNNGYRILSNPEIPLQTPDMREISGSTLLTAAETISQEDPQPPVTSHSRDVSSESSAAGVSSPSGNDEATWETVVEMMETRHGDEVNDLKEDHELKVTELKEEIERLRGTLTEGNQQKEKTQKRVTRLLRRQTSLMAQVNASNLALQEATSASQKLQAQYDELKEKYEESLTREENLQSSSSQPGDPTTSAECLLPEHKALEQNLIRAQRAFREMSRDFNEALDENRLRSNEVYDLRQALELHPEHDIGLKKVIDYKNHMLQTLETRAGQCFSDYTNLQKKSTQDKDLADGEISRLKGQLTKNNSLISQLRSSIEGYQERSEGVLATLQEDLAGIELIQGLESVLAAQRKENHILSIGTKSQEGEIDEMHGEINRLRADLLEAKRSSDEKDALCKELQQREREKDAEMGNLQIEYEILQHDSEQVVEEKEKLLAEAQRRIDAVTEESEGVMNGTLIPAARDYITRQRQDKAHFRTLHQQASEENHELRRLVAELKEAKDQDLRNAYWNGVRDENFDARLAKAEEEVKTLREENHRLENLPHAVHISKVSRLEADFEAAQEEVLRLARVIREEDWKDGNGAYRAAVDTIKKLKISMSEILDLIDEMNDANQAGEPRDFNEVKEYVELCREHLDNVPSCGPDEENSYQEHWMPEETEEEQEPEATEREAAEEPEKEFDTSLYD